MVFDLFALGLLRARVFFARRAVTQHLADFAQKTTFFAYKDGNIMYNRYSRDIYVAAAPGLGDIMAEMLTDTPHAFSAPVSLEADLQICRDLMADRLNWYWADSAWLNKVQDRLNNAVTNAMRTHIGGENARLLPV